MGHKTLETRLDQVAEQWARLKPEGNEAARQSLYEELFTLVFQLYDWSGEMWVVDAFEKAIKTFDPDRKPFSHYFSFLMKYKRKDAHRHSSEEISLQSLMGEEQKTELEEFLEDPNAKNPEDALAWEASFLELTSMVLNFAQLHSGKSANEARRRWYRIFYTEDMTLAIKTMELNFPHERDMFAAMMQTYLDYYMSAPCTSSAQICTTPLLPYGQVVPERAGEERETPLPIPADVSLSYLLLREGTRAGASTRSNQMKFYKEEKELMRPC